VTKSQYPQRWAQNGRWTYRCRTASLAMPPRGRGGSAEPGLDCCIT